MTPKFRCQARRPSEKYSQICRQNTVDGKEDFIMDIISPSGVNKTDKTQASPEFAHESPYFHEFWGGGGGGGGHCTASTQGRVRQHV